MLNEVAEKWVAALRSGEYEQGKGQLRTVVGGVVLGHCCLGVLCDLYAKEHPDAKWTDDVFFASEHSTQSGGHLPDDVMVWSGVKSIAGRYGSNYGRTSLAIKNDSGATFDEIAAIIESEPAGLFA